MIGNALLLSNHPSLEGSQRCTVQTLDAISTFGPPVPPGPPESLTGPTEDEEKEEKHEHHLKDDAEAKLARHLMMTMMIVIVVTMMMMIYIL